MSNSGWNRSAPKQNVAQKKPSAMKGVWAGLAVVAVGVAAVWFVFSNGSVNPQKGDDGRNSAKIKGETPAKPRVQKPKAVKGDAASVAGASRRTADRVSDAGGAAKETAASNSVSDAAKPKKKRVFQSGTDQLIAMAMSVPPGVQMPPLPGIGSGDDKEFVESLKRPIKIEDDDSESIKAIKATVQQTREEIVKLMEENPNMSFGDILQEHRKIHNENADTRGQVVAELQKIIDEGDVEGAMKFRTTMNFALQQMGIEEIDTPITEEEKAEAEERAKAGSVSE